MKYFVKLGIVALIVLVSCKGSDMPTEYVYNATPRFTKGYAEFYGSYFSNYNIPHNVVTLVLLSDSLNIDEEGSLTGTGQLLVLEDILIAKKDTFLPDGIYTITNTELPYTAFGGEKDTLTTDNIYPSGAMISYYEENSSKSITKLIVGGTFIVSTYNGNYTINTSLITNDSKNIKGRFTGTLPYYDRSVSYSAGSPRNTKLKHWLPKISNINE